jgi:hypothetical protein
MKVKIVSAVCSAAVVICAFAVALFLPRLTAARIGSPASYTRSSQEPAVSSAGSESSSPDDSQAEAAGDSAVKSFAQNDSDAQAAGQKYIVKIYGGKIAIFVSGSNVPEEISDVDVSTLPQSETDRLASGIGAASRDDALRIVENLES